MVVSPFHQPVAALPQGPVSSPSVTEATSVSPSPSSTPSTTTSTSISSSPSPSSSPLPSSHALGCFADAPPGFKRLSQSVFIWDKPQCIAACGAESFALVTKDSCSCCPLTDPTCRNVPSGWKPVDIADRGNCHPCLASSDKWELCTRSELTGSERGIYLTTGDAVVVAQVRERLTDAMAQSIQTSTGGNADLSAAQVSNGNGSGSGSNAAFPVWGYVAFPLGGLLVAGLLAVAVWETRRRIGVTKTNTGPNGGFGRRSRRSLMQAANKMPRPNRDHDAANVSSTSSADTLINSEHGISSGNNGTSRGVDNNSTSDTSNHGDDEPDSPTTPVATEDLPIENSDVSTSEPMETSTTLNVSTSISETAPSLPSPDADSPSDLAWVLQIEEALDHVAVDITQDVESTDAETAMEVDQADTTNSLQPPQQSTKRLSDSDASVASSDSSSAYRLSTSSSVSTSEPPSPPWSQDQQLPEALHYEEPMYEDVQQVPEQQQQAYPMEDDDDLPLGALQNRLSYNGKGYGNP
ncbi:hypothetical protein HK102_005854, partial [Quaeritorhiza haematococci]